ncbi:hypothetical protein [Chromatium okenii]|jgi:hypothetical protein|uniref:hypothetical protein n=1 Tax=Chromatium okenii TaxID=61644 RepID=UPI0026F31A95|nr:hypothetical protein [Chromatium okenii]MBV5308176.1 hypothetical protein [Chromatium okenii]
MSEVVLTAQGYRKAVIFPVGAKGAGMEIVAHYGECTSAANAEYVVRYLCCGKEVILEQKQVLARINANYVRCNQCRLELSKQRTAARMTEIELEKRKARYKNNLGHYAKTRIKQITSKQQDEARKQAVSGSWT